MSAVANYFEVYNHCHYNNNIDLDPLLVDCDSILDEKLRPSIFYATSFPRNVVHYSFNNEASFDNCVTNLQELRNFERSDENRFSDCFDDETTDSTETNFAPSLTVVNPGKSGDFSSKVRIIRIIKRRTQSTSVVNEKNDSYTAAALHNIEFKRSFSDCLSNVGDTSLKKSHDHQMKREKNNASVKRCREKKRLQNLEMASKVKTLTVELAARDEQITKLKREIEGLEKDNQKLKYESRRLSRAHLNVHIPLVNNEQKTRFVEDLLY